LPVQIIDPEVHRLLEDGPVRRRRFLDWGVFHVEQRFHEAWRRYQRALRQRNSSLKLRQPLSVLRAWDQELVEQGNQVAIFRETYLQALRPFVCRLGQELLGLDVECTSAVGNSKLSSKRLLPMQRCVTNAAHQCGPTPSGFHIEGFQPYYKDRIS
jgi:DNA replication and repair protein RecF